MKGPGPRGAAVTMAAAIAAAIACAQEPTPPDGDVQGDGGLFSFPGECVAWWAFDPGPSRVAASPDYQREVIEGAMRAVIASGLLQDDDAAELLSGLLVASVAGSVPHRLCVQTFTAAPENTEQIRDGGGGMRITSLRVVLELLTREDHESFLRTVQAVLVEHVRSRDPAAIESAVQGELALPGGYRGVRYRQHEWPRWREVSWASLPDRFVVGLGQGALAEWLTGERGEAGEWPAHARAIAAQRPAARPVLGMFVDINALRRGFPEAFAYGRAGRIASSLGLSNARAFSLQARALMPIGDDPPLVSFDATWSARSDQPGTVHLRELAALERPSGPASGPSLPAASYVVFLRNDVGRWLDMGLDAYTARLKPWNALSFTTRRESWSRRHGTTLRRVVRSLGPWVVLTDDPPPPIAIPGVMTIYAPLARGADPDRFADDLEEILGSLTEHAEYDEARRVWWLRLVPADVDPHGALRVLTWGLAGPRAQRVLVVGWGARVVEEARRRLGE